MAYTAGHRICIYSDLLDGQWALLVCPPQKRSSSPGGQTHIKRPGDLKTKVGRPPRPLWRSLWPSQVPKTPICFNNKERRISRLIGVTVGSGRLVNLKQGHVSALEQTPRPLAGHEDNILTGNNPARTVANLRFIVRKQSFWYHPMRMNLLVVWC